MSKPIQIWKVSSLLLLGLFVFVYIVSSTVADIYFLVNDPVVGITYEKVKDADRVVITHVVPKGPADLVGIREGDMILKLNRYDITDEKSLYRAFQDIEVGDPVKIVVSRRNVVRDFSFISKSRIKIYTGSFFAGLLPGVVFCYTLILIGVFVLLKKAQDKTVHIFYLMVLFWALAMWGNFPYGSKALLRLLPGWFEWIFLMFLPMATGLLLHFTLLFPEKNRFYKKHKNILLFLCYGILLLIFVYIYADVNQLPWRGQVLQYGWGVWISLQFFVAFSVLGHSCHTATDPHVAGQASIMYRGTMLTLGLPLGLYFIPKNIFNFVIPYSEYFLFLMVFWPMTLAYAIIKHRFMDVRFIIKRSLAFALISGFVVAAYFLLVVGVGRLFLFFTGSSSQILTIVATLLIAAIFNPVKNRIQNFVENRFYPNRYSYREAVRKFSHQLVNVVDLEKLIEEVSTFFSKSMAIHPVAVFYSTSDGTTFRLRSVQGIQLSKGFSFNTHDGFLKILQAKPYLQDFSLLQDKLNHFTQNEQEKWRVLGTEIVLPLINKSKVMGFVSIGSKENDETFYKEDIELLEMLNDQLNISVENALLTEELKEQERLKKELEVARKIQLSSLPQSDPVIAGLDVSGISIPAMEVGGDYYDYITLPDGCFGVVVGDVSGKGTSAALYMSQLKGILQTAAKFHTRLTDLMAEVNSVAFNNIEEQSFITLTCGTFDLDTKKFKFVRAGHLPLIYFSKKNKTCQQIVPRGIGIGLEDQGVFKRELEESVIAFESGDVFLFYSDGIVEARNSQNEEFDFDILQKLISQNGYDSAFTLRESIIDRVRQFVGDEAQTDDMTLVVVKVK